MADRGKHTRHEGIFRKANGNWFIQVVLRHAGGFRSVERTLPKETPESEVVAARARLRIELEQRRETGIPVQMPVASKPTTVADYCEQWIRRKKGDWRAKTLSDNMEVLAKRILPLIGHIPLQQLKRSHILEWRTWAESQRMEKGQGLYSGGTLSLWWRVLRGMLGDAIADHELSMTLVFKVKPPRSVKPRVRTEAALSAPELGALLAAVHLHHPAFYAEAYTLAFAGMRPGELYALIWNDVDLPGGRLVISKSVVQGKVGKPKNGKPRIVALTDGMRDVLAAHRITKPGLPGALVFPNDAGGYRSDTTLHHVLVECSVAANIEVRVGPQVLRYTANTLLREAGVADEIVRDRLGHSTREMGHRYFKGHLDAQKAAVEQLRVAVEGGR